MVFRWDTRSEAIRDRKVSWFESNTPHGSRATTDRFGSSPDPWRCSACGCWSGLNQRIDGRFGAITTTPIPRSKVGAPMIPGQAGPCLGFGYVWENDAIDIYSQVSKPKPTRKSNANYGFPCADVDMATIPSTGTARKRRSADMALELCGLEGVERLDHGGVQDAITALFNQFNEQFEQFIEQRARATSTYASTREKEMGSRYTEATRELTPQRQKV